VSAPTSPLQAGGKAVARASDITALVSSINPAPYTTATFPTAGTLKISALTVDAPTLSTALKTASAPAVVSTTTGKFSATVTAPASNTSGTDPVATKSGTWTVSATGQVLPVLATV
jgi:hypothetical protein